MSKEMQPILPGGKQETENNTDAFVRDAHSVVKYLRAISLGPLGIMAIICIALMASEAAALANLRANRSNIDRVQKLGQYLRALSGEQVEAASYLSYYENSSRAYVAAYRATDTYKSTVSGFGSYKSVVAFRPNIEVRSTAATTTDIWLTYYSYAGTEALQQVYSTMFDVLDSIERSSISALCETQHYVASTFDKLMISKFNLWDTVDATEWIKRVRTDATSTEDPLRVCLRSFSLQLYPRTTDATLTVVTKNMRPQYSTPATQAVISRWKTYELARLDNYHAAWNNLLTEVTDDFDAQDRKYVAGLVLCLFGAVAATIGAVICVVAISQHAKVSYNQAQVQADFSGTESHLGPFQQSFATMNVGDFEEAEETGLRFPSSVISICVQLVQVLKRVRPFLPQSVFGEMEGVTTTNRMSSKPNSGMLALDVVAPEVALVQAVKRDLRTEIGMQLVNAVVMYVSLDAFNQRTNPNLAGGKKGGGGGGGHGSESDLLAESFLRDVYEDDYLGPILTNYVNLIQRAVNSNHGVVHCISEMGVVCLWNVMSSTYVPQVNALQAAIEIVKGMGSIHGLHKAVGVKKPSICIVTSDAMAGNVYISPKQKSVVIVGRAAFLSEKLDSLNEIHGTCILMDKESATNVQGHDLKMEWCVRPVQLMKDRAGDEVEIWAFHMHRIRSERLKAWTVAFQGVQKQYFHNHFDTGLQAMKEYLTNYGTGAEQQQNTKKGKDTFDDLTAKWMVQMLTQKMQQATPQAVAATFAPM